jgi:hypothetical protein
LPTRLLSIAVLAAGADASLHGPGVAFPLVLAADAGYREVVRALLPVSPPAALQATLVSVAREAGKQGDPGGHVLLRDILNCIAMTTDIVRAAVTVLDAELAAKQAELASQRAKSIDAEADFQLASRARTSGDLAADAKLLALAAKRRESAVKCCIRAEQGRC